MERGRGWWGRLRPGRGLGARRPPRNRPTLRPEVATLEGRVAPAVGIVGQINVIPHYLPSTQQGLSLPVVVTGKLFNTQKVAPTGFFHVTDQYRRYEPFGSMTLVPDGTYGGYPQFSFRLFLRLPAKANSGSPAGRHYYILVGGKDADNVGSTTVAVNVPTSWPPPPYLGPPASLIPKYKVN